MRATRDDDRIYEVEGCTMIAVDEWDGFGSESSYGLYAWLYIFYIIYMYYSLIYFL